MLREAGYDTYLSAGEADGIAIAARYLPDMIVYCLAEEASEMKLIKLLNSNTDTESILQIVLSSSREQCRRREAMELGVDDFICPPCSDDMIINSVKTRFRKRELLKRRLSDDIYESLNGNLKKKQQIDHVLVTIGNKIKLIKFNDIVCIKADKEYSTISNNEGCKIIIRKSLNNWEETLPPQRFLRIHRSTIINLGYLDRIEKNGQRSFNVYLKNMDEPLSMSQRYANIMRRSFPK